MQRVESRRAENARCNAGQGRKSPSPDEPNRIRPPSPSRMPRPGIPVDDITAQRDDWVALRLVFSSDAPFS
jgi:hypothetical protein